MRCKSVLAALVLVALPLFASSALAASVVVPSVQATTEGNANNAVPFDDPASYQQVYAASEFGGAPVVISGIAFRADDFRSAASATFTDLTMSLSTTSAAVGSLSVSFASNVGADETVVVDASTISGGLTIGYAQSFAGPAPFDVVIPFATSFLYDPSAGNLLLEVRSGGRSGDQLILDLQNDGPSGTSTQRLFGAGLSATTGLLDGSNRAGLVTQFQTQPIPEPSGLALFGLGAAGLAVARRRRVG